MHVGSLPIRLKAPDLWRRLFLLVGGGMLALSVSMALLQTDAAATWGPLGVLVGMLTSGALFYTGSRALEPEERQAWGVIGAGVALGGVGVLMVGSFQAFGWPVPAFGPLDVFFVGGYIVALVGLGLLPVLQGSWRPRLRIVLDGLVGAVSIAALLWATSLRDIWMVTEGAPLFDRLIGSLYPLLDTAMLIGLMLVTVRRGSRRFDVRLLLLAVGYTTITFADLSYLVAAAGKNFEEAEPNFMLYLITVAALVAAGAVVDRVPGLRDGGQVRAQWWTMVIPYGVAVLMVTFLGVRIWRSPVLASDRVLFIAAVFVAVLVIARQSLAIQENRMLVEEERSALVSSISHELRTPLTSMIGFMELLESDQGELQPGEREEFSQIVRDQANYMGRMVMDLVLLSRDDHSMITLSEEVTSAEEVALAALHNVGPGADRISFEVDPGLRLRADGDRVIQIIANLLTNGIRYGGTQCLLRMERRSNDLIIEVHDNGPGVPKKHQQTIWERFERGAHRYSSNVRGSGIGLAIVAAIAEAHRGSAGYRTSERLGGACFTVTLPGRVVEATAVVDLPDLAPRHRPSLERS